MPSGYDPYAVMNPYAGDQRRTGGAQMNGGKGSGTMASTVNAWQQGKGGDPYSAFGNLGMAWSGALGRKGIPAAPSYGTPVGGGQMTTYVDPRTGSTMTHNPNQRIPIGMNAGAPNSFATPFRMPGEGSPAPAGSTRVFGEPATNGAVQGYVPPAPGLQPRWAPLNVGYYDEQRAPGSMNSTTSLTQSGGAIAAYNPSAGETRWDMNGDSISGANPFAQPVSNPWNERASSSGETSWGNTPIGIGREGSLPGTVPNGAQNYTPQQIEGMRRGQAGSGTIAAYNPMAQPVASPPMNEPGPARWGAVPDPWGVSQTQDTATDREANGPTRSVVPVPASRPPLMPSTQPEPGTPSGRPPLTPSTQPPPNPFANPVSPDIGYGPGQVPTFAPRGGTMAPIQPITPDIGYGPGQVPAFAPSQPTRNIPNAGGGQSAPSGNIPQYTPSGQLLGTNGIGRRYSGDYAPAGEQGASGHAVQNYEWRPDPNNPGGKPILTTVDASGNPAPAAAPATSTTTQTGTGSMTGTYAPPNGSTTFDPNVLPDSNVGKWFDPVMQDTMDKLTRQLRHEGSLTGATNSGGFIPGMSEALAPVANQFAAQKGQLMYQDQQAKADRLLDKYKFDNTQQLQQWIEQNQNELQRYGIDQNVLLGRYSADKSLQAAGMGAGASMYGADAAANASRQNAMLDYLQGMAGIGANYGLGQQRLGFDYYNADQNYGLGQQQLGYNYWNSDQQRGMENMFNQRGYDLGMTGINRDVYGMDQAQQRYLMDLMWRMSPGGQMGGGYFPTSGVFPYGG